MKSYLSLKPGATFFLGSSRTLVYHIDDVEIIYRHKMDGKKYPAALPFHPLVADGCNALMKVSNKLYNEISSNCSLKLWKDRLTAVWGDETR